MNSRKYHLYNHNNTTIHRTTTAYQPQHIVEKYKYLFYDTPLPLHHLYNLSFLPSNNRYISALKHNPVRKQHHRVMHNCTFYTPPDGSNRQVAIQVPNRSIDHMALEMLMEMLMMYLLKMLQVMSPEAAVELASVAAELLVEVVSSKVEAVSLVAVL